MIYAVIRMDTGFSEMTFAACNSQQTSFDTIRKSLDGTLGILKWSNSVPEIVSDFVVWSGDQDEMLAYLQTNKADWENSGAP